MLYISQNVENSWEKKIIVFYKTGIEKILYLK